MRATIGKIFALMLISSSIGGATLPCVEREFFSMSDGELSFEQTVCQAVEISCVYKKTEAGKIITCNGVEVVSE